MPDKNKKQKVLVAMSPYKSLRDSTGQAGGDERRRVVVAMYTKEGLKFEMVLGPLKFEPLRRGRPRTPVAAL